MPISMHIPRFLKVNFDGAAGCGKTYYQARTGKMANQTINQTQ